MTRLERTIKCMNEFDDLINLLLFERIDKTSAGILLGNIQEKKRVLINELREHGCRREK